MSDENCARYVGACDHADICQRCTVICPFDRPNSGQADFRDWDGSLEALYEDVDAQRAWLEENHFVKQTEFTDKWWLPIRIKAGKPYEPKEFKYR